MFNPMETHNPIVLLWVDIYMQGSQLSLFLFCFPYRRVVNHFLICVLLRTQMLVEEKGFACTV